MPDPAARFWDKTAERYAATPVSDQAAYERKLEITRGYLTRESSVFEFGCGTGTTALHHAPHAGTVTAIDVSPEMIRIAREKERRTGVQNVTFEVGAIEEFDAPPGSFDMVMAHSVLFLVADRAAVLAKCARLLKPGGVFVSSTACLSDMGWYVRPAVKLMNLVGKAPPVRFFSADELRAEIRAAGFEIVEDWQPNRKAALFLVARKTG